MHDCHPSLISARKPARHAAGPRTAFWVIAVGLLSAAADAAGQDRIRIVEAPRTAMRDTRSLGAPPRQPAGPARPETASADQAPAVYAEHFVTEMRDQYQTVYVPVIESQTEPTPAWWNPLRLSTGTFQPRPVVRWEQRIEKIRVPVRYRELVPETQESLRPTFTASSSSSTNGAKLNGAPVNGAPVNGAPVAAAGNRLTTRAAPPAPNSRPTIVLPETQFGGISQLDSDQPRYGTRPGFQPPRVIR